MKRVVVTGLGVVSPLGSGKDVFWERLLKGESGVEIITAFDATEFTSKIAAQVKDFNPQNFMDKKDARRCSKFIQFAVAASRMALEDSKINMDSVDREQLGVIIGSGIGGLEFLEEQTKILYTKGPNRLSPFTVPMMINDMAAGMTAIILGAKGPNSCPTTACASGTNAIGDAFKIIQREEAKAMIAGGSEASITPIGIGGFCAAGALSMRNHEPQRASRPFDAQRDGFVMGEGAGIAILEELEHAKNRGAKIYSEVVGYGMSGDAYHITSPDPDGNGQARAMIAALNDAGIKPEQNDYINAHGTSTQLNDKLETKAIKTVFGEHAKKILISSTKSMIGHLLGAAGGVEFVATVMSCFTNKIHPTINYEFLDPDCDLDYVPNIVREKQINYAMSNSFGFGGHNAILVVRKWGI